MREADLVTAVLRLILFVLKIGQECSGATTLNTSTVGSSEPAITEVPKEESHIVWNGCESNTFIRVFSFSTVTKPRICFKGLPEYLENVRPEKGAPPFVVQVKQSPNATGTVSLELTHRRANDLMLKVQDGDKGVRFRALYVTAQSSNGAEVGQFLIDTEGSEDRFDLGYCCGDSRQHYNLYELVADGGVWSANITWKSMQHRGLVQFKFTVVQDDHRYWQLDPVWNFVT